MSLTATPSDRARHADDGRSGRLAAALAATDPAELAERATALGVDDLPDDDLFEVAAALVARPGEPPADSFRLHAPLELLARRALLGGVAPAARRDAQLRLVDVAVRAARAANPQDERPERAYADVGAAREALVAALAAGEVDDVDPPARWLAAHADAAEVASLAGALLPSLAAAGHAPIFLWLLPRCAPRSPGARALLRPLVREVARQPGWRIGWVDDPRRAPHPSGHHAPTGRLSSDASADASVDAVVDALLAAPVLGRPGSDFIHPLVHQVDAGGLAAEVVGGIEAHLGGAAPAGRALARAAAWSMVLDDPAVAPYGWTHALTLPQAAAGVAAATGDPRRAGKIAATYLVAFRAGLGSTGLRRVPPDAALAAAAGDPVAALDADPPVAAAAAWHAGGADAARLWTAVVTQAALDEDAHLAKYVLATRDASAADPAAAPLFRAAAAHLAAWWRQTRRAASAEQARRTAIGSPPPSRP